jgi:hypothetical protein
LVGDALLAKPVQQRVATFDLSQLPPHKSSVDFFAVRSDIAHSFRAPEDRPNRLLALVFTGLVALPFLWLLGKLMANGSLSSPGDANEFFSSAVFHSNDTRLPSLCAPVVVTVLFCVPCVCVCSHSVGDIGDQRPVLAVSQHLPGHGHARSVGSRRRLLRAAHPEGSAQPQTRRGRQSRGRCGWCTAAHRLTRCALRLVESYRLVSRWGSQLNVRRHATRPDTALHGTRASIGRCRRRASRCGLLFAGRCAVTRA